MTKAQIILEYFRLFTSWPVMTTAIILIFIYIFKKEISEFITKICNLKAGPIEMSRQLDNEAQKEKIDESLEKNAGVQLGEEQIKLLDAKFDDLVNEVDAQKQTVKEHEDLVQFLAAKAELNEFAYLDLFFVPNTKTILNWFLNVGQATKELYNQTFSILVSDNMQKEAIMNVLLTNGMLESKGVQFAVTEKAKRFLKFIGKTE